jgi:hypothetical protein
MRQVRVQILVLEFSNLDFCAQDFHNFRTVRNTPSLVKVFAASQGGSLSTVGGIERKARISPLLEAALIRRRMWN